MFENVPTFSQYAATKRGGSLREVLGSYIDRFGPHALPLEFGDLLAEIALAWIALQRNKFGG